MDPKSGGPESKNKLTNRQTNPSIKIENRQIKLKINTDTLCGCRTRKGAKERQILCLKRLTP